MYYTYKAMMYIIVQLLKIPYIGSVAYIYNWVAPIITL